MESCKRDIIEEYANLPDDMCGAAKRWQEWLEFERPEDEPLPGVYLLSCSCSGLFLSEGQ